MKEMRGAEVDLSGVAECDARHRTCGEEQGFGLRGHGGKGDWGHNGGREKGFDGG